MYHNLSYCILRGDTMAPRSIGAFWNGSEGCGLGRALLATGWPMEIPFLDTEVDAQWPWLTTVNPEGHGGTFSDDLSALFNKVFYGEMTIEDYAEQARVWEAVAVECGELVLA